MPLCSSNSGTRVVTSSLDTSKSTSCYSPLLDHG